MAQTVEMKRAAFEKLMQDNGFQYLGATTHDGSFIFERTWRQTCEVAFYGEMDSSYKIKAHMSYDAPIIQLYNNGRHIGTRGYSSPKRAVNAIREIIRFAGYAM